MTVKRNLPIHRLVYFIVPLCLGLLSVILLRDADPQRRQVSQNHTTPAADCFFSIVLGALKRSLLAPARFEIT